MKFQANFVDLQKDFSRESQLILLLTKKDEQAFNYLYDNYGAYLYGHILSVVGKEDIATQVLTETFKTIWIEVEFYDHSASQLMMWMMKIANDCSKQKAAHRPLEHLPLFDILNNF